MIIGLIGMSGAGKSTWARRLAATGWRCLHCDDLIADKLRVDIDVGAGSIYDLGRWMGFPYEQGYAAREARYLEHEAEVLADIAAVARQESAEQRLVIDMTGSAIYVDEAILAQIHQIATVVYLAISPDRHQQLIDEYRAQPRPLVWNALFRPLPNEEPATALTRCYSHLIAARERIYEAICDVRLDETLYQSPDFTVEALVAYVERFRLSVQQSA